ncbi:MAG TPA: hypothetical protein VF070_25935 [Streptosporangiaceae bacterium]
MFEHIYCARESYENEVEATDRLGWVNGNVLRDLTAEGILKTVDWKELPVEIKDHLIRARESTLTVLPAEQIRAAIRDGDASTLELAKALILEPVLDYHGCIESGAPNSITNWISARVAVPPRASQAIAGSLAEPLIPGAQVCRPPGTGISEEARRRQQNAQDDIERPMIPKLLAGEGMFAGRKGFEPYFRKLEGVKSAYEAANDQLNSDWQKNRRTLFRLREAASRYLWADLHGTWLPRLADQEDKKAAQDFERWVRSASRMSPIASYLESRPVKIIVGSFGTPALAIALAHAGIPWPDALAGAGLSAIAASSVKKHFDQVTRLALFFQEARKATAASAS